MPSKEACEAAIYIITTVAGNSRKEHGMVLNRCRLASRVCEYLRSLHGPGKENDVHPAVPTDDTGQTCLWLCHHIHNLLGSVDDDSERMEYMEAMMSVIAHHYSNFLLGKYHAEIDFDALEQVLGEFVCADMCGR